MVFIFSAPAIVAQRRAARFHPTALDPARKDTLQLTLLIAVCESWTTSRHAVGRHLRALRHALAYDARPCGWGLATKAGVSAWSLTPLLLRGQRSIPVGNRAYRSWTCRRACQPAPKTPYALPLGSQQLPLGHNLAFVLHHNARWLNERLGLLVRACSSRAETNVYHAAMPSS